MSASEGDRTDGPGAMYDAARAALLGTARGDAARSRSRRVLADALARLGAAGTPAGEAPDDVGQERGGEPEERA